MRSAPRRRDSIYWSSSPPPTTRRALRRRRSSTSATLRGGTPAGFENFNIGITPETQRKFGLDGETNIQDAIGSYQRLRIGEKDLNHGIVDFHRASIEQDVAEKAVLRQELLKRIATNVEAVATTGELVRDNESIQEKVSAVGTKAVARANSEINESRAVPVTLYFTAADRDCLRPFFEQATDGFAVIPEHELQDILFRTNSSENPGTLLVHQNPIAKFCAAQTFEERCAKSTPEWKEKTGPLTIAAPATRTAALPGRSPGRGSTPTPTPTPTSPG